MEFYLIDIIRVALHLYLLFFHYLIYFIFNINEIQNQSNLTLIKLNQLLHFNNLGIIYVSSGFIYGGVLHTLFNKQLSFKKLCKKFYLERFKYVLPITYFYFIATSLLTFILNQRDVFNIINRNWHLNLFYISNLVNVEEMVKLHSLDIYSYCKLFFRFSFHCIPPTILYYLSF